MRDVAVTIRPGADVAAVALDLSRAGLQVEHRLDAIGSITGRASSESFAGLRTVPGVESVSEIAPVQIAPPDSAVQ